MKKVSVDESLCIRCGACMSIAKDVFGYGDDGESVPKVDTVSDDNKDAVNAMEGCPTGAIKLEDMGDGDSCKCENCDCGEDCDCGDNCECECDHDCGCKHCDCEK